MIKSAFEITKIVFDMSKMWRARIMHIKTGLLNRVGNIEASESNILGSLSDTR
jgi:hypothetical protein